MYLRMPIPCGPLAMIHAVEAALQQLGVECWHAPHAARVPAWLREHGPRFHAAMVSRHYVASELFPLLRRWQWLARTREARRLLF